MARNLSTQDISWFLDLYDKEQLDLDPPYQRRSVWSTKDKRFFIDTILNNYPAPPIFLHKTLNEQGKATYHVVDGKQRLQTVIDFAKGLIRIPDDFSDVTLQKKRWKDLERPHREQFWNYILIVEMLPDVSDSSVKNIFERINRNSRKLMPQELRHAKYDGWFVSYAEAEAQKKEWEDFGIVSESRAKRMADVQFISELMTIVIRKRLCGFDQDDLDNIYAEYDDLADQALFDEEDFRAQFESVKTYIREVLLIDPSLVSMLKIQSHFYTLWGYISLMHDKLLPPDDFVVIYKKMLSDVASYGKYDEFVVGSEIYTDTVFDYFMNSRGASTDLAPRQNRHNALITVVHEIGSEINEDC